MLPRDRVAKWCMLAIKEDALFTCLNIFCYFSQGNNIIMLQPAAAKMLASQLTVGFPQDSADTFQ